jgi:hypothetical protein
MGSILIKNGDKQGGQHRQAEKHQQSPNNSEGHSKSHD